MKSKRYLTFGNINILSTKPQNQVEEFVTVVDKNL